MSHQGELFPLSLGEVLAKEQKLEIEKALAIERAYKSGDVDQIYQAQSYLRKIEQREVSQTKSLLVDPLDISASFGYKDKPFTLSYQVLRAMARTHVVKAIVETRKEQVLSFCEPQSKQFSTGFVIAKRRKYTEINKDKKPLTKQEEKKIEWFIEFLLSCGTAENFWHSDTFDVFISKLVKDSLELDQGTFEIARNRGGDITEFFATDAATYRIADSYNDDETNAKDPEKLIKGYAPSYVQLYQGKVNAEFYPWELCFGVRNPSTDIRMNGYGKSELEDMIQTVTAILNADTYNSNFFKVGSAPKGILRYSGNINQNTVEDFKRQWIAQVVGAMNAHKIPLINADKLDFINTHIPNKDMEFSKFQEFLIKITCAIYKIDPSEIGFPMSGNTEGTHGLGGDNQEEKVKYSRDKGLKPLLKKIQYWINKYIIWQIDPEYEFRFVGIDEEDEQTELDRDALKLQNWETFNEVRARRNLEPLPGGDIPANPVYLQAMQMQMQQQQQEHQMDMDKQNMSMQQDQQDFERGQYEDEQRPFGADGDETEAGEDPFMKSLASELELLLCE